MVTSFREWHEIKVSVYTIPILKFEIHLGYCSVSIMQLFYFLNMQTMVDEEYICHASGNKRHKFIYGFYLYYISVDRDKARGKTYELLYFVL